MISFVTAVFFLPETKGKTLEEIEKYFETAKLSPDLQKVVTQLGFLGREFGSRALGEWICSIQDVLEQREGRFNLT